MQHNQKGVSLVMAVSLVTVIIFISHVSYTMVTSNAAKTRAVYGQTVVTLIAEDGPADSTPTLVEDADDGFVELLAKNGAYFTEKINYDLFGDVHVALSIRDNDDLDDSSGADVDKTFILTTRGYIVDDETKAESDQVRIAAASLEVLVRYIGNDDQYAQETGSSKSNSNFASEVDVSDF